MSLSAGSDPWQMPGHTHTDDRITFGCPGCIHLAERARVANAPKRLVVWHCRYLAGPDDVRTLTVARKVRVPDGWTGDQVDQEYLAEVGEAFVMALPDDIPIEYTDAAMETMEVTKVVIGELVLDPVEPQGIQGSLL